MKYYYTIKNSKTSTKQTKTNSTIHFALLNNANNKHLPPKARYKLKMNKYGHFYNI